MWKKGPEWLKTSINATPLPEVIPDQCVTELKTTSQGVVHNLLTTQPSGIGQLIDIRRFSGTRKSNSICPQVCEIAAKESGSHTGRFVQG